MKAYTYILSLVFLMVFIPFQKTSAQEILSLESAKTMALTNNKKIKKATQTIEAAKAAKASVYASDKPFVDASVMGLHVGDPLSTLLPEFNANASLGVTQVIYAGGKINTAKKLSNTAVNLYTSQKELTDSEVLLDVETTYWQLVNVKGKVTLATKYKSLLTELLKDLTNLFDAGIIYKNDVLQVQVQLNQAELDLSEVSKTTAIENRPEIKMLKNAVEIEELQTKIINADRKPTVALNVSGIYANGKQINFSDGSNDMTSYYGLLSVNIPVFDWGSRKQKVKEQNLRLNEDRFEAGTVIGKDVLEAQVLWQQAYSGVIDAKAMYKISEANYKKVVGEF